MADYEKRPPELSREVALLQERALEEERRGGPPAVLATYVRLQAGVAVYVEWRAGAIGKVVELPAITMRSFLNDLGLSFASIGSPSDGYYFILLNHEAFSDLYDVEARSEGRSIPASTSATASSRACSTTPRCSRSTTGRRSG